MPVEIVELPLDPDGPQLGDDGLVVIEWGATPSGARWRPTVWHNGRDEGVVSRSSLSEARQVAERLAHKMAARYVGDWTIAIGRREEAG